MSVKLLFVLKEFYQSYPLSFTWVSVVSYLYTIIVSSRLGNYLMPINVLSVCSEVFHQGSEWKLQELCKIDAGLGEEGTWLHFHCLRCYHTLSHLWGVLVLWTLVFTLLIDPPKGSKASRLYGSSPGRSGNPPEPPDLQGGQCAEHSVRCLYLLPTAPNAAAHQLLKCLTVKN